MTNKSNIAKDAQAWIEKGNNFNPMVNISIEKLNPQRTGGGHYGPLFISAVAADFVLFTSEYKSMGMLWNFNKMLYIH